MGIMKDQTDIMKGRASRVVPHPSSSLYEQTSQPTKTHSSPKKNATQRSRRSSCLTYASSSYPSIEIRRT
ncbi:hypothetical protein BT69DRAFT_1278220 [Atractiella rhizophila]|nr:hypothetical protein BT69DRAFT_1278220 [Atractiella rhizophila]